MKYYFVGFLFFMISFFLFYISVIEKQNEKVMYPYKMKLYFPTVDGIKEGTEVSVKGIPFGLVKEVKDIYTRHIYDARFITNSDKAIELTLIMKEPITLWDNYEIKFKSKTVFSNRIIDIDPGNYKDEVSSFFNPTYNEKEEEPMKSPSSKYYDEFFTGANNVLVENKEDIRSTVSNLKNISFKIKNGKGTIPQLINNDIAYNNLNETILDIRTTAIEGRRYFEMLRENDTVPITFTMVMIFNYFNLNILSQGKN